MNVAVELFKQQLFEFNEFPETEMLRRSKEFHNMVKSRRTVREFSSKPVPKAIIENCLKAAGTAPSARAKE